VTDLLVTMCDGYYAEATLVTLTDLRRTGYHQDVKVVYLTTPEYPNGSPNFDRECDRLGVEIVRREPIDCGILLEKLQRRPMIGGDGREIHLTIQWSKLYSFDPTIVGTYDKIGFVDGSCRIGRNISDIFNSFRSYDKRLYSQDDTAGHRWLPHILDTTPPEYLEMVAKFGDPSVRPYICNQIYFYGRSLLDRAPILSSVDIYHDLLAIKDTYPICRDNEMSAMSLMFCYMLKNAWAPLIAPFYSDHRVGHSTDYYITKYCHYPDRWNYRMPAKRIPGIK
jgi:hypothetical protein